MMVLVSTFFNGNFDGNGFEIKNIYENTTTRVGLFKSIEGSIIKNVTISGEISGGTASGIVCIASRSKVYNCYNRASVKGGTVGGIVSTVYADITMINCCNLGSIFGSGYVGGLIGFDDTSGNTKIINCYNIGTIKGGATIGGYSKTAGILGGAYANGTRNIINCCSNGKLTSTGYTIYQTWGGATIGLENCYYSNEMVDEIKKVYANSDAQGISKNNNEILEKLNYYVEQHKNEYQVPLYNWKMGEGGYPVLEYGT